MLFFVAVMMSVVGFAERPVAHAAVREKTIYDGSVENLISAMSTSAKKAGVKFWGKRYYLGSQDGKKHCSVYIGDNKKSYVLFKLNDDNSVVAYTLFFSKISEKNSSALALIGEGLGAIMSEGMSDADRENIERNFNAWMNSLDDYEIEAGIPVSKTFYVNHSKTKKGLIYNLKVQKSGHKKLDMTLSCKAK